MDKQQHISALYEIAMSIGNSLNLRESIKHTINTYIRQLDCAGISVYEYKNSKFNLQLSKPKNISKDSQYKTVMNEIFSSIDNIQKEYLSKEIPYILKHYSTFYHICSLEGFGIMVIIKNSSPFEDKIYRSIQPLHQKFSQAIQNCINNEKVILQESELLELNENLEERVKDEILKNREKDQVMLAQSRQAAMGDMISMIAHQWRQPITAIGMSAQNMQLDIELDEIDALRFDKKLTKIVLQTEFLSKTIDDFRNFLKPNKKTDTCMLSQIADGALNIIAKSLENNNITLVKSYEHDVEVTTFKNEVIQVILNIINNAKDIIRIKELKDSTIWLELGQHKDMAYFNICDNAGGIPENVLPRIFEPYFTTKDEKGGTGLGLYMSKMIIEKHIKGIINAKNSNGGACFSVLIPLKTAS